MLNKNIFLCVRVNKRGSFNEVNELIPKSLQSNQGNINVTLDVNQFTALPFRLEKISGNRFLLLVSTLPVSSSQPFLIILCAFCSLLPLYLSSVITTMWFPSSSAMRLYLCVSMLICFAIYFSLVYSISDNTEHQFSIQRILSNCWFYFLSLWFRS